MAGIPRKVLVDIGVNDANSQGVGEPCEVKAEKDSMAHGRFRGVGSFICDQATESSRASRSALCVAQSHT
jgi:hypothetical protein